jgi:outer membrane receptor protein involved in Fe transport
LTSDVNAFYCCYRYLYRLVETVDMTSPEPRIVREFADEWDAYGAGGEAELRYAPFDWLSMFGNYSLLYIGSTTSEEGAALDTVNLVRSSPHHAINAGFEANIAGFALSVYGQYRSPRRWQVYGTSPESAGDLPSAFIVNCRAAYRYKNAEVGIAAFNLFDRRVFEYPQEKEALYEGGYPLQQKVTVRLRCTF